jgi:hypothetical protein
MSSRRVLLNVKEDSSIQPYILWDSPVIHVIMSIISECEPYGKDTTS